MKRKLIISVALFLGFLAFTFAQNKKEENQAKKIAFITKFLELTPDESKAFWPIYEERNKERKEKIIPLRKSNKKEKIEEMTDDEVRTMMKNVLKIRQMELDIKRKYLLKFLKILPPKKVAKLYHIEKRFRKARMKRTKKMNRGK